MNFKSIEYIQCPQCSWRLTISKDIWNAFPNQHETIEQYLKARVENHSSSHHLYNNISNTIEASKRSEYFIMPDSISANSLDK